MFEGSVLIVAHPDDDVLWMGSVIDKVESIIFCFNDDPSNPEIGLARKKTIGEYPLSNVSTLDFIEPGSWDKADWNQPVATDYGIKLERSLEAEDRYQDTYEKLIRSVRSHVANRKSVFTHNPWGEYGHEEHVLVYRVLKALQAEFHYDIWYSNYCSNRSVKFMNNYISGFVTDYQCLPVNTTLASDISQIYRKHSCWTWYEDYQWFEQECLMREKPIFEHSKKLPYGRNFPVNYIKIDIQAQEPRLNPLVTIASRFKMKLKHLVKNRLVAGTSEG